MFQAVIRKEIYDLTEKKDIALYRGKADVCWGMTDMFLGIF